MGKAGRLCLAKSVVTSLSPSVFHAGSLTTESVYDFVDKKLHNCISAKCDNTRSWNLVYWEEVTRLKELGGLELRSTRVNNIAMLGKLVEDLLHDREKPWVLALSQKYLGNNIALDGNYKAGNSYIW